MAIQTYKNTWSKSSKNYNASNPNAGLTKPKTVGDLSNQNKITADKPVTPTPVKSTPSNLGANAGSGTINGQAQDPSGTPIPRPPSVSGGASDNGTGPSGNWDDPVNTPPPAVTPTPEPTGDITPPPDDYTEEAESEIDPIYDDYAESMDGLKDEQEEQLDEKILSLEESTIHQIETLDELQKMMEELTAQKNAIVAGSADVQNMEIKAAYDANAEQLRIAKLRLDETQRQVMIEREKQLDRKTMNEENMLAVIGGFGSMAGNKMLLDSVSEGEQALGILRTEFSFQDMEHTADVVKLTTDYKNDKIKVEQWKQEQVLANYENLQSYIANIMEDKEMAYQDKVKSINQAKDSYNDKISQISMDVINARFDLSREVITRSDELRQRAEDKITQTRERTMEDVEIARGDLALLAENYSLENFDTLGDDVKQKFAELEKQAGLPEGFTEIAIKNFKEENKDANKIMSQTDENGNWTIVGLDKAGNVVAQTTLTGAGKNTSKEPTNPMEKEFNVGSIGGECGTYASTISTGAKVGNTWDEKFNKTTTRENPKPGYKLAIPLGVNDRTKDPGHIAVVLSYNPETGEMLVTQSNKKNEEKVSMEYLNINDLKAKYGEDWGFIPGELKGDWKRKAIKMGLLMPDEKKDDSDEPVFGTDDYDKSIETPEDTTDEDEPVF